MQKLLLLGFQYAFVKVSLQNDYVLWEYYLHLLCLVFEDGSHVFRVSGRNCNCGTRPTQWTERIVEEALSNGELRADHLVKLGGNSSDEESYKCTRWKPRICLVPVCLFVCLFVSVVCLSVCLSVW